MTYNELVKYAEQTNKNLTLENFKPGTHVLVYTHEGYFAVLPSAFIQQYTGYYVVYSEHRPPQIFDVEDIVDIYEFKILRRVKLSDRRT